jgi:hypothetical protein
VLKDQIDLSVPDVEASVRMAAMWQPPVFQAGDREPITSDMVFADEDFFNLFSYNAVEGNLENALKDPMTVVLTENLAEILFGHELALGKTLKLNNNHYLTVSAVLEERKPIRFCRLVHWPILKHVKLYTRTVMNLKNGDGIFSRHLSC